MATPDQPQSGTPSAFRMVVAALTLSASGLVGIAVHEGYRGEAYYATADEKARGISTIGYGDTHGVKPGDRITPDRALIGLLSEADSVQRSLRACIGAVPLAQREWDAYVSWAYNVGPGAACSSTLVKKLKATTPDYAGACRELLRWNQQSGQVLPGLTKRRQAEYATCSGQ